MRFGICLLMRRHSVDFLWTSDRPVAKTCTWKQITLTAGRQTDMPPASERPQNHVLDRTATGIDPRAIHYLLTYSMVQSPSWETNWFAASQIPRISRNPKVHYRTHKRPPPVCILGQLNPVHIPTSHLLEIQPNIIHPSTPRSPQWSPSFPPVSPARPYKPPSPQPYAPHAQPISFFSILSPAQYWVRSTNHLARAIH